MSNDSFSQQKADKKAKQWRGMRFQERDGRILAAIQNFGGGKLARRQLKELIFRDRTKRAMDMRLSKLCQHDYLERPTPQQRRAHPVPEPLVWIGWKGALWLAGQQGIEVAPPLNTGENQLRQLERRLRDAGFRWLREPGWSKLAHDLAVIDFLLAVERSIRHLPRFVLEDVIQESAFRTAKDKVEVIFTGRGGKEQRVEREVVPDLFLSIVDRQHRIGGEPGRARLLVEYDGATHSTLKWGKEKAVPYALYIKSPIYKERFGHSSGRWLVVTTGQRRMKHLMKQTRQELRSAATIFWFTTMPLVKDSQNVLTAPIWLRADWTKPGPLFQLKDRT